MICPLSPGRIRSLVLTLAAALLMGTAGTAQLVPAHLERAIERIDSMAAAEYAKDQVGGLTIGVVHGADLVWTRSYGQADVERKVVATKDTVYRIGSITKQFTGLMLLQLVEAGVVRFGEPVERSLPEVNKIAGRPQHAPPITLVQLATMNAGIGREPENLSKFLVGPVSRWEEVMIAALGETTYEHEPGTRYFYSNIGYAILGAALSRAAKMPYTAYVQQHIVSALGMTHTAFEPTAAIEGAIAKGYEISKDRSVSSVASQREHAGRGYKVPNGALYSTVGDLARFLAFELGEGPDSVLRKATLTDVQSRVASAGQNLGFGYGIGFQLRRRGEHVFLGHNGSVAGYTAEAWIHRSSRTGFIALRNAAGGTFDLPGLTLRALSELAAVGTVPSKTP